MESNSYEARALRAYFRACRRHVGWPSLNPLAPGVTRRAEHDGLSYILLSNHARVVAVYRITNGGSLKRLRRWPVGLA